MGDGQTDYSSSESLGSDKYFNILSTILEECNEDAPLPELGSSSDPSDANKTGESDSTYGRPLKGSKTKKKVAFVLPTRKDDDWVQESQYRGDVSEYKEGSSTSELEEIEADFDKSLKNLQGKNLHRNDCSWGKLKTVFDILDVPELSEIFKGFESDCCTNKCQDTALKIKKGSTKKKKSSKKGKYNKEKAQEFKKEEIHEYKCDHSKLMRNEDGTRIEVDHHFNNSSNPALLNWLDKKNKEEKKKRKEERKAKKQERKEKKMQVLAQVERKNLSDTLVKDWMRKKKKEFRKRFSKRKVEPDGASHASLDTKGDEPPVGYTRVETFSSEGASRSTPSSGPPSRIGATDSGLSTTSVTSFHNSFNSTNSPIKSTVNKVEKTKTKTRKNQATIFKSNILVNKDDDLEKTSKAEPPKIVDCPKTSRKASDQTRVQKRAKKQRKSSEISFSDPPKVKSEMQHMKERRKRKTKVTPAKEYNRDEGMSSQNSTTSNNAISKSKKDENGLETEIILKETKRRSEEKHNMKKRVSSWHNKEGKSIQKSNTKRAQYNWITGPGTSDTKLEQTAVAKHMTLHQRPEPQGSDDVYTSNESVDEVHKDSSQPVSDITETSDDESSDQSKGQYSDHFENDDSSVLTHSSRSEESLSDDNKPNSDISLESKTYNQEKQSSHNNNDTDSKLERNLRPPDLINRSVTEDVSHVQKTPSQIRPKNNRDFDDCLDFFLEDYHRPWMEL